MSDPATKIAESWARHFPANQKCSVLARAYLDSEAKLMAMREEVHHVLVHGLVGKQSHRRLKEALAASEEKGE